MFTRVFLLVNFINFAFSHDGFKSVYETVQIIRAEGYVGEAHGVLTPDGYLLEMHRIPYPRNQTTGARDRPVVFVMHGLLAASNSFIYLGPEYSIAYNLADAGFDVWMGNARGTKNSRQHINLDPGNRDDRMKFFDFTWEQIGYHDIASMVDYILGHTNNTKLHYIGHSQGGTVFLVLNSMRPEYNSKFISAHLLAGVGYKNHFPNRLLSGLAMFTNTIYNLALRLGIVELFPPTNRNTTEEYLRNGYYDPSENFDPNCESDEVCRPVEVCTGDLKHKEMCEMFGLEEIMSARILDNILTDFEPGGAALKQIAHYGQNIQDKAFRQWNLGPMENFQRYGTHEPPIYNISLITVNTTMHYTINDNLLDERDVLDMCADMPYCRVRKVARDTFLHVDFVAAGDVKELVTDYIVKAMWIEHQNSIVTVPEPDSDQDNGDVDDNVADGASSLTISNNIIICLAVKIFSCIVYNNIIK